MDPLVELGKKIAEELEIRLWEIFHGWWTFDDPKTDYDLGLPEFPSPEEAYRWLTTQEAKDFDIKNRK